MKTYYVAGIPYSDELYHHGIKGQKWGIRRFENEDGTLTPAGKARYSKYERGLKNNKTDDRYRSAVRSEARKIFDRNPDLDKKYGNKINKNASKIVKKAKKRGEDTSDLEKAIKKRDDFRSKNGKSIRLGYRTSEGKKYVESGHTMSSTILDGIGKSVALSALTYGAYKFTVDQGMSFVPELIKYAGIYTVSGEIGDTLGRAWQVKNYNEYSKLKSKK